MILNLVIFGLGAALMKTLSQAEPIHFWLNIGARGSARPK